MQLSSDALQGVVNATLAGTGLFSGTGNVNLSKTNFNPVTGANVTVADFDGYAAKAVSSWVDGTDPVTLNPQVQALPPVGGFSWLSGANATANQSIYGAYITSQPSGIFVGGVIFAQPRPIAGPSQRISLDVLKAEIQPGAFQ